VGAVNRGRFGGQVQFRSGGGGLGLDEQAGEHAAHASGDSGAELAGLRSLEQVFVGEIEQQVRPAAVVPLDGNRELTQVGVPWVFELGGEHRRIRAADDQVLGGEKAAELLVGEAHPTLADGQQGAAQHLIYRWRARPGPGPLQEQTGLRHRE